MSYYINCHGTVITKPLTPEDIASLKARIEEELKYKVNDLVDLCEDPYLCEDVQCEESAGNKIFEFVFSSYSSLDTDYLETFLMLMKPYTEDGEIECDGEGGEMWRYMFHEDGWHVEEGIVSYVPGPVLTPKKIKTLS